MAVEQVESQLMVYGHSGCAGCGQSLAARTIADALGPEVIIANATGCLEVFTTRFPHSSWRVPWIHSLFENPASVGSGIEVALRALGRDSEERVVVQAGDGGTADIGIRALSGMLERGHDILYVCYDNGSYSNTGFQRSSLTPFAARTTTSPTGLYSIGNKTRKKDLPAIVAAHGVSYIATASSGYPVDIKRKVKKAMSYSGPKYLQVHVPCVLGWGIESNMTIKVARAAVNSGIYPLFEMEDGEVTSVRKIKSEDLVKVDEYLRPQKRFKHLFKDTEGKKILEQIQEIADSNIERYELIKDKREE